MSADAASVQVSVVLPARNAAGTVRDALESLARQTWTDFEAIVIDDGSTDATAAILNEAARSYPWLRVISGEGKGISRALNRGIAASRGDLIARMDADDVAHPRRLERQVTFLETHPAVGICGGAVRLFGAGRGKVTVPGEHDAICARLIFGSAFVHPTVMFRRSVLPAEEVYQSSHDGVEDYLLWCQLARRTRLANLPEVLLDYRLHEAQATAAPEPERQAKIQRVQTELLGALGLEVSAHDARVHATLGTDADAPVDAGVTAAEVEDWLMRFEPCVAAQGWCRRESFVAEAQAAWWRFCRRAPQVEVGDYWRSPFRQPGIRSWLRGLRVWRRSRGHQS